ncbi:MAG: ADP-heptose--lipooligosaccharide heptosyltransferase II [uncultured Pyrinomonadaceae bacterium]|uniref:lipopolysaccharide heptosyltransferase II n=1 Tax=uncultured Pyrinomonadaceae bacterium TaxID=2283094 RepID=A0A6J4PAL7_9BACT|nr:MAG: ADP-heptose--lipooligosaccharide heptosyltransferase II [uncultured Pyrinomonadaceae bacterium]
MKIVVRGTNWIGDAVMQIPALRQLRRVFPAANITLHTRTWAQGIFEDADFLDEILTFEKTESKIKDALAQAKILREKNYDLAVLFPNSFESALVAKLASIPKRFGYATDARGLLLTDAVTVPEWKTTRHEVFYYLNLVAAVEKKIVGAETVLADAPKIDLEVSGDRKTRARRMLAENGVNTSRKVVALGVGSTNSRAKRWSAERYAELNDRLQNEANADVILVGAADELEVSNEVYERSKNKPIILTGKTDLAEAAAILSLVDLLVSNDMGLAHVASAVGAKTLVIFGPTNPRTTRPWNAEIIYKNVECSPCMLRDCPIDHRCMTRISADEVFSKAVQMIYDKIS